MRDLLDLIACYCGGDLRAADGGAGCEACGAAYPTRDGVLLMTPAREESDAERLQSREEVVRDRQVGFYDFWVAAHLPSRIERRRLQASLDSIRPGDAIELGCGTGRWTRLVAPKVGRMVAIDRSFRSLAANRARIEAMGLGGRVLHVKADATGTPARSERFDVGLSGQLLEHLPTAALRDAVLAEMRRTVAPRGHVLISAYEWRRRNPFARKKEGLHAGGMFYYRFEAAELESMMRRHFGSADVRSCLGAILLARSEVAA